MGEMLDWQLDQMVDPDSEEWLDDYCPDCGGPLHEVAGKFGVFYGCDDFPKCKGARKFKE